jgi:hypothetical protein
MSISKKHHYTPRYYLKRFENNDGSMWRLDKDTNAIVKGNGINFGYKKHWNTLRNPPTEYEPDWAEKRLSEVDGYASVLVERIVSGELPTDIRAIACALSFMTNNQPRVKLEAEKDNHPDIKNWSNDHWLLTRMKTCLEVWPNYVPIMYSVYVIDENDTESRFLTSSNPLIELKNMPTKIWPISNKHCLFLSFDEKHRDVGPRFDVCENEMVTGINRLTIENSWQYLYSNRPDFSE